MNLYIVTRWGNNVEGPDGEDTNFLVQARDHEEAARVVDEMLLAAPHKKVQAFAHACSHIGRCTRGRKKAEARILLGAGRAEIL